MEQNTTSTLKAKPKGRNVKTFTNRDAALTCGAMKKNARVRSHNRIWKIVKIDPLKEESDDTLLKNRKRESASMSNEGAPQKNHVHQSVHDTMGIKLNLTERSSRDDNTQFQHKLKNLTGSRDKHLSGDVAEGCTVFIKSVPFDADEDELCKVCRKYGDVHYTIINRDVVSGHPKGTAFVKFKSKDSADLCLNAGPEFAINGEVMCPMPAISRVDIEKQRRDKYNDPTRDSRNLYLAREGLIMAGSKASDGVSAADVAKRHNLEQIKTQVLKNLNRFVSRNRLSIHNLPLNFDNEKLKELIIAYTGFKPHECRVMRTNSISPGYPQGKSKGFGFMSFNTHQEALTALRKLNNNPKIFSNINRPIVAFSIEDRAVHNIKEKRQEKSRLHNPTYKECLAKYPRTRELKGNEGLKHHGEPESTNPLNKVKGNVGLKLHGEPESTNTLYKVETGRTFMAKAPSEMLQSTKYDHFVGMVSMAGSAPIRMRSNQKIRDQAQAHNKRVKAENRKKKQTKIRQMHKNEQEAGGVPLKRPATTDRDDLATLVTKYKRMIDDQAKKATPARSHIKKPKTKWYQS